MLNFVFLILTTATLIFLQPIKCLFHTTLLHEDEIPISHTQLFESSGFGIENSEKKSNDEKFDDKNIEEELSPTNSDLMSELQHLGIKRRSDYSRNSANYGSKTSRTDQYDNSYADNFGTDDARSSEMPYQQNDGGGNLFSDLPRRTDGSPYYMRQTPEKLMYSTEIAIKQGRIKGIIRNFHPQTGLGPIGQFLGLPYAEAPVGSKRFMPPGTPPPWHGLKIASHLPPVCPQSLPDLGKMKTSLSKGRYDQLTKLMPYLKNESEDCLHLNIYVPKWDGNEPPKTKFSVIVYIHGESYEWNSGNPYEGSVLASIGQVIVVTLNYRLGVLGFMKPGISDHTVSNFGILDQIAALQWVKENIAAFGGDSESVTLMGHGTGAACANLLMVSPVARGLFHRAILMSGSAMSDWATTNHSLQLTMQIAHGLNCPITDADDEMLNCLRRKRYQEILNIQTSSPQFSTPFGPVVDGLVIPNQPYKVMGQYTELFSRYDLLFGVTEVESYHVLNGLGLEEGLRENERDNLLRFYMQNRFEIRPDLAMAATLRKYTDIYNNPVKASSQEHRDVILDILSDAQVVSPLIQTGIFHAKVNPTSYMYVFGHNSESGAYARLPRSIVGEELAFVFGAPLAPSGPFHTRYSAQERLLSEAVITYWTNFAKTGNPKAPWRDRFLNLHALVWQRYDIDWPEFNVKTQSYMNIGFPPSIGDRYRSIYMNFWNKELPDELNQISSLKPPPPPFLQLYPPSSTHAAAIPRSGTSSDPSDMIQGRINLYPGRSQDRDKIRTLKDILQDPIDTTDMYNAQPTTLTGRPTSVFGNTKVIVPFAVDGETPNGNEDVVKAESTMHILVGVVVIVIFVNIILITTYMVKRNKCGGNKKLNRKINVLGGSGDFKRAGKNSGSLGAGGGEDDSYVLDIIRKSNKYENVKTYSPINGFKMSRHLSSSTVDAHTKVCDWISQDMTTYSPKSAKKSPTFSLKSRSFFRKPKKISIAIDATPQNRSDSVLRQEPIELTKHKSIDSKNIIICQEIDIDSDFIKSEPLYSGYSQRRRGSTASIQEYKGPLKIDHRHSRSDPVEMYYPMLQRDEQVTSFIDENINQTSRDSSEEKDALSPEQQLQNIKRRNFPKVLPDYPSNYDDIEEQSSLAMRRRSLPAPNYIPLNCKLAPVPPPRTIATLGRRPSGGPRRSQTITTSPLMVAEDTDDDIEPEITENTLIVGPLLPKSQENLYSTIKRKKIGLNDTTDRNQRGEDQKYIKPSGIRPPCSTFQRHTSNQGSQYSSNSQSSTSTDTITEAKINIKAPSPPPTPLYSLQSAAKTRNIPRVHYPCNHDSGTSSTNSKIPQFKNVGNIPAVKASTTTSFSADQRENLTPESSSSTDTTSSSAETVKTDLKQNK